jgi:outer membrane immunogenic protein
MKVRNQGMLAMAAGAAAILASGGIALADGWTGAYVGFESGVQWARFNTLFDVGTGFSNSQDPIVTYGFMLGYQHQFGPLVIGVEADLIGTQADRPASTSCPNPTFNCQDRINDLFTVGPRVGWALGKFMPYATGGYASGSVAYNSVTRATGVQFDKVEQRQDGWFAGGGVDWKISHHAVLSVEYRHYDLGTSGELTPFSATASGTPVPGDRLRQNAEADSVMVRGSLLFGGRDYAPMK